eukprot:5473457-Prorocentrum_lima.AAC.1
MKQFAYAIGSDPLEESPDRRKHCGTSCLFSACKCRTHACTSIRHGLGQTSTNNELPAKIVAWS